MSGRMSRRSTRNPPSDARRLRGDTWRSEPDANAHIRRYCMSAPCRRCSRCLGSSCFPPSTDMSHAGTWSKIRIRCLQPFHPGIVPSVISLDGTGAQGYGAQPRLPRWTNQRDEERNSHKCPAGEARRRFFDHFFSNVRYTNVWFSSMYAISPNVIGPTMCAVFLPSRLA
jgi:hypothetical protein